MNGQATGDEEIFSVFDEALPVIHVTLVSFYRFMEEEAEAFEDTLLVWFERMARRNASQKVPISELRAQLLYVACKYARAFQIARFKGIELAEENFTMALAQTPEEVAAKLLHKL
jgi:alkanesulfonate monooxygenase SsuD/methylene tetrahydromethanopterin reductase-like flavin-dependent oxidoreductase (luciferase family)